jgi:methionyl-tRNA formyltransferase
MIKTMKVKFFAKERPGVTQALKFLMMFTKDIEVYIGKLGEPIPEEARKNECDILISYISPWIIPKEILILAKQYAINFHPGSPEYPGIGCTNFALYEGAKIYGVTCHLMEPKVDTGKIIAVKRFPIFEKDNVETLTDRAYSYLLILFYEVIGEFFEKGELSFSNETWKRRPFTRKQLNELSEIKITMTKEEVERIIRATYYPNYPYPFINFHGYKFVYNEEEPE